MFRIVTVFMSFLTFYYFSALLLLIYLNTSDGCVAPQFVNKV